MANIHIDAKDLTVGLEEFETKALAAVEIYAETQAKSLESYTKEHRPWTDRTGDARKRLTGSSEKVDNGYQIALSQGVDYGIWLELANEKRFAILEPAVRLKGPEVVNGLTNLLNRIGGINGE